MFGGQRHQRLGVLEGGETNLAVATANGLKSLSFHRAVEEGEAEERRT